MKIITNCFASSSTRRNPCKNTRLVTKKIHRLLFNTNPLLISFAYFLALFITGHVALCLSKPRVTTKPSTLDLIFTSVSAATVSSLSTIEIESFSNFQLIVLTILMFMGGEVFTSFLGIQFRNIQLRQTLIKVSISKPEPGTSLRDRSLDTETCRLKLNSVTVLGYVVLGYLLVINIVCSTLVFSYVSRVSSSSRVLRTKSIELQTFSFATSFSNCGFIPTNENMILFNQNSGLLLILTTQILLGNTLYPAFLYATIFALKKITKKREFSYMIRNEISYDHLLPGFRVCLLALTAIAFIAVQLVLFCVMEWNSEAMNGLSSYQKIVASLFQVANSRHSGESTFDISLISPAILVLFVVMMYLPPYTCFLPIKDQENKACSRDGASRRVNIVDFVALSNLSYLAIFVILICISERESMKNDPLNFNVLNVVIEVISAYGNVGFSTGYSCERRLNQEDDCTDKFFGLSGKCTSTGKILLIIVMLFGRLKKFNMKGGKAWQF